MSGQDILFYIFSTLAIAFSILVVAGKNPINSAFSLVLVFFCVAADYALMHAHLIATLQILVYAGAIMVLFVFVIMLLNTDAKNLAVTKNKFFQGSAGILCASLFGMFYYCVQNGTFNVAKGTFTSENVDSLGGNTQVLSQLLFSDYALPFELTSILLLVGIAGSVSLAKRKLEKGSESRE